MAIRPSLKRAVPETLNKASDYNDNFDLMMDFVDASVLESKNYIEGYIPPVTGQSGKFMTNNGTVASWAEIVFPNETGFVKWYSGDEVPAGYLLCDGSAISRETYANLFSVIGTMYGAGDSITTFNLPNLINLFIQGSGTVATVKSAGLPNIWGVVACVATYSSPSGAFYYSGGAGSYGGGGLGSNTVSMSASRSSGIYGASNTVQPPALTLMPVIKY